MRRRNVFASLLAVLVMHFAPASAETPPIVVGVYIPSVAFGDSMARARFAEALAAALASATGRPARGRAVEADLHRIEPARRGEAVHCLGWRPLDEQPRRQRLERGADTVQVDRLGP